MLADSLFSSVMVFQSFGAACSNDVQVQEVFWADFVAVEDL